MIILSEISMQCSIIDPQFIIFAYVITDGCNHEKYGDYLFSPMPIWLMIRLIRNTLCDRIFEHSFGLNKFIWCCVLLKWEIVGNLGFIGFLASETKNFPEFRFFPQTMRLDFKTTNFHFVRFFPRRVNSQTRFVSVSILIVFVIKVITWILFGKILHIVTNFFLNR